MKKKLLKSKLKELIRLNEQNVNSVPQIVDPFNFLVPYNFSGYSGPNLTAQANNSNTGWEIGTGGGVGPAQDCNVKTNIGLLATDVTTTAVSPGEAGSVFFQILEYLWNSGDFNKEIEEIVYETPSINLGWLDDGVGGFWNSEASWPDIGSIGLCYNVENQTGYRYQRTKYFVLPGGPSFLIRNIQDALDAIQEIGGPNLDVNLFESFDDFIQAVEAFQIACAAGGCAGKCYCCCRDNGCLEGAGEYIVGCTDEEADNYNPLATYNPGSIGGEDKCVYSGCTDPSAYNYNSIASIDDGSCMYEGCTDPDAANYDNNANVNDGSCEYPGCINDLALNFDPNANVDDGSCEFNGFICPPDDSLAADGCVGVPAEPGTMFPLEVGPDGNVISETLVYVSKEECDNAEKCVRKEGGEKILCWKCTDKYPYQPVTITVIAESSPLFEQDEKGRMIRKKKPTTTTDKEKVGCPGKEGYQIAPEPFWTWEGGPYDTMQGGINNPCSGPERPDRPPPGPDSDPILGCTDSMAINYNPQATEDDGSCEYVNVGGPWFCPADAGNFPWPTCCVQTGIVYNNAMNPSLGPAFEEFYNAYSGYPQIQFGPGAGGIDGVNYFTSPIGQTYNNNETCNANSSCGENMQPLGVSNCAGTYSPDIDDDFILGAPVQSTPSKLRERFIKLAGIKKKK